MDLASLESWLRLQGQWPQHAAFYAALIGFGLAELVWARDPRAPDRRRRWTANAALTVLNIAVLAALPVTAVVAAGWAAARGDGLLPLLDLPVWAALAAGILLRSLISYGTHWAMHKVPALWRLHRVHHADPRIDVSSTVRFHPLEFAVQVPVTVALVMVLGIPPLALMLYDLLHAAMVVFNHANVRLPRWLDRPLGWVLVTPDMHRIHHSARRSETDSNFGVTFPWWDRLFGTYRPAPHRPFAELPLGLAEVPEREASSLGRQLALPFVALAPAVKAPR